MSGTPLSTGRGASIRAADRPNGRAKIAGAGVSQKYIRVVNAREHNLREISVDLAEIRLR